MLQIESTSIFIRQSRKLCISNLITYLQQYVKFHEKLQEFANCIEPLMDVSPHTLKLLCDRDISTWTKLKMIKKSESVRNVCKYQKSCKKSISRSISYWFCIRGFFQLHFLLANICVCNWSTWCSSTVSIFDINKTIFEPYIIASGCWKNAVPT